ncbi:hypothetical protein Lfu02_52580 [Longispora fulva]|uniref:Dockerin domain-containing protein n=1 Tax=Longispora fulva TaxID=619741 RepID=A0A8J7GXF0_9ACTN|nr:hypothetical protein [Longispora fulva]MBG6140849.1 hypothetical protein [Longispora fulva]GIG60886.1 hypothetical protein Lfu02_52580 [Longispora fulva]
MKKRYLAVLVPLALAVPLGPTAASAAPVAAVDRTGTPAFAVNPGELRTAEAQDRLVFSLPGTDYTANAHGDVLVGFSVEAAPGSGLNPGIIRVRKTTETADILGAHTINSPGEASDYGLATLCTGTTYEIQIKGNFATTGGYELVKVLVGDANADFVVDAADLAVIGGLQGKHTGDPGYSAWADTDRDGVIDADDTARANRNLGAATSLRLASDNPLDQVLPDGALQLAGLSATGFNATSAEVAYTLTGAAFDADQGGGSFTINGNPVPTTVTAGKISAGTNRLVSGKNVISFKGYDTTGRPLYRTDTIWAGNTSVPVRVVDDVNHVLITDLVTVRVSLSDNLAVYAEATTTTGTLTIPSVPARTILVKATASGNRLGVLGDFSSRPFFMVELHGFKDPSPVKNNDFSQGTAGWNTGGAPVQVKDHVEGIPHVAGVAPAPPVGEHAEAPLMTPASQGGTGQPPAGLNAPVTDKDLTLGTAGQGEQSISRAFQTDPDVVAVKIRFRFVTSEVPGGYFGSQYNDYYRVSIRSQQGGDSTVETNSMNGLGLGAFDYGSGATAWRELKLKVDKKGDTIQVDLGVANVADGLLDSQVVVDFVEEIKDQVEPKLAWNNTQGGLDLRYEVKDHDLEQAGTIDVYWASGAGYESRIGTALFSHPVPAGDAQGAHGPVRIAGSLLQNPPAGATHLIAASSPNQVGAIADVTVGFGAQANQASVAPGMITAIKNALRSAGQSTATITSTARTPADQARAMFNNLVNPARTVAQNTANQLALYQAPGRAVVNRFTAATAGMTLAQINANAATVRGAMQAEIVAQGPSNVSRHCADPAVLNVVDVGAGVFNASNGPLFVASVTAQVTRVLDERATNSCYHLELQL